MGRRPTGKARPYFLSVRLSKEEQAIYESLCMLFCEELYYKYNSIRKTPPKSEEFRFLLRKLAEAYNKGISK